MLAEQQEADRLLAAVRDHKRAARRHRNRSVELLRQLDRVVAAAAERGIRIHINRTAQPGEQSGNHPAESAQAHAPDAQA